MGYKINNYISEHIFSDKLVELSGGINLRASEIIIYTPKQNIFKKINRLFNSQGYSRTKYFHKFLCVEENPKTILSNYQYKGLVWKLKSDSQLYFGRFHHYYGTRFTDFIEVSGFGTKRKYQIDLSNIERIWIVVTKM
jgi:hypothetical protein